MVSRISEENKAVAIIIRLFLVIEQYLAQRTIANNDDESASQNSS